jgi:hypothetical protein
MYHESAYGGPQGVGSEAYLNGKSQSELVLSVAEGTPEDTREDGHIHGRSRLFMEHPGWIARLGGLINSSPMDYVR